MSARGSTREREIHAGPHRALEAVVLDVAGDADDGDPGRVRAAGLDPPADAVRRLRPRTSRTNDSLTTTAGAASSPAVRLARGTAPPGAGCPSPGSSPPTRIAREHDRDSCRRARGSAPSASKKLPAVAAGERRAGDEAGGVDAGKLRARAARSRSRTRATARASDACLPTAEWSRPARGRLGNRDRRAARGRTPCTSSVPQTSRTAASANSPADQQPERAPSARRAGRAVGRRGHAPTAGRRRPRAAPAPSRRARP